jgi:EAL domain-containing protein (putative c-di-GMP-specific phosphodiesterase class I)
MAREVPVILEQQIWGLMPDGTVNPKKLWVERNIGIMNPDTRVIRSYLTRRPIPNGGSTLRDLAYANLLGNEIDPNVRTAINLSTDELKVDVLVTQLAAELLPHDKPPFAAVELVENKGMLIIDDREAEMALFFIKEWCGAKVYLDDVSEGHHTWTNALAVIQKWPNLVDGIKMSLKSEECDDWLRKVNWAVRMGLQVVLEKIDKKDELEDTIDGLLAAGINLDLVFLQGNYLGEPKLVYEPYSLAVKQGLKQW